LDVPGDQDPFEISMGDFSVIGKIEGGGLRDLRLPRGRRSDLVGDPTEHGGTNSADAPSATASLRKRSRAEEDGGPAVFKSLIAKALSKPTWIAR
jgi:hypothetical protein